LEAPRQVRGSRGSRRRLLRFFRRPLSRLCPAGSEISGVSSTSSSRAPSRTRARLFAETRRSTAWKGRTGFSASIASRSTSRWPFS